MRFVLAATAAAGVVVVEACVRSAVEPSHGAAPSAAMAPSEGSSFREVASAAPPAPAAAGLLEDALRGVDTEPGEDLGTRMEVRALRIPRPGRGGTQRFTFDGDKRGWIASLPSAQLLTSPAYADGKVFLGGGFASHRFFAFDAFGGDLAWSLAAPDGGPTAAVVESGRVLFNTESCTLFVADAATGALQWKRWLGDPLMSQPAIGADLVLSAYPKDGAHRFGAFRLEDGAPVWDVPLPADIIQAPQVRGDSAYFATMDGTAFRVRVRDGHVMWRKAHGATSALWVDGERVLLTRRVRGDEGPSEEPVVLSKASGAIVRRAEPVPAPYLRGQSRDRQVASGQAGAWGRVPHGDHLGLRNVASGWAFQGASPAVADGRAYLAVGSELRARDVQTGELVWKRTYGEADGAQAVSPPAVVGNVLVYGTLEGHLYVSDIDTGMTLRAYDVGEPVVFQPIVAQGWVYVATGAGNLIGLELGDAQLDGWHMWGGNAQHAGLVPGAGAESPEARAARELPARGMLRVARFEDADGAEGEDDALADAGDTRPELPLVSTRFDAEVSGFVATVQLTQSFTNPHDRPLEAVYLFPLPGEAAVDDMEMRIGDRVVRGQIRRRAQARREYAEARESGRRAALLEQSRPSLFVQRVANVGPGETIEVKLQYVQPLPYTLADAAADGGDGAGDDAGAHESGGAYELVFPLSAPPRFDPRTPGAVLAETGELRQADAVEVRVHLAPGMPLRAVTSPSHSLDITRGERDATVRLQGDAEAARRDFVLRYQVGGDLPEAAVLAYRGPRTPVADPGPQGYLSLVVQPPVAGDVPAQPRSITFVLDRSSSMRGAPMQQAKAVMRSVLASLQPDDRVNVLTFSDRVDALAPAPAPADAPFEAAAAAFLGEIRAVGATAMVPALERALAEQREAPASHLPLVVLLSDGNFAAEDDVLRAVSVGLGRSRFYGVGLGAAQNRFLLTRAAEVGGGRALHAGLADAPEQVAAEFTALIDRPVFTDVEIDWGGLAVEDVYPRRTPDLFAGRPLVVHGRFAEGGTARVRVRGTLGGRRYERSFSVTLPERESPLALAAHESLWARAAVRERMNQLALRDDPAVIEEITELGLAHRLVTAYTSFVAIEERREEPARASISPARSLPGDPEIRIPAPPDARAVTILLPFGETLDATYEPELGLWTARFLIPADAEEGTYPIEVLVAHRGGRAERLRLWYTVDAAAPTLELELVGEPVAGSEVTLRATQVLTEHDLAQVGRSRASLTASRAQLLQDARRVQVALPVELAAEEGAEVLDLVVAGPGVWETTLHLPPSAAGEIALDVTVADVAANVRTQAFSFEVQP
ncbi:MAG: VIT domain-containing protein [Myxococcota bacterium]